MINASRRFSATIFHILDSKYIVELFLYIKILINNNFLNTNVVGCFSWLIHLNIIFNIWRFQVSFNIKEIYISDEVVDRRNVDLLPNHFPSFLDTQLLPSHTNKRCTTSPLVSMS
jgi:hypothetical protein